MSVAHSRGVMPRKYTAIAKAAIWPSLTVPSRSPCYQPLYFRVVEDGAVSLAPDQHTG